MARKRIASRINLLSVREVQVAAEGDSSDGGGLLLRVRGTAASWVLRYTSIDSRRREMGLGVRAACERGAGRRQPHGGP